MNGATVGLRRRKVRAVPRLTREDGGIETIETIPPSADANLKNKSRTRQVSTCVPAWRESGDSTDCLGARGEFGRLVDNGITSISPDSADSGPVAGAQVSVPTGADENRALLDFAASQSPAVLYSGRFEAPELVQFVSANARQVVGWSAADLMGAASIWRGLVHPSDQAAYVSAIDQLRTEGEIIREYRMRAADGSYRWIRDQQRLAEQGDRRGEYVGCLIDITAEKAAESDLVRANAINRAIVDASADAVITMDCDGRIMEFNTAAEQMFRCSEADASGTVLCDLMFPEHVRGPRKIAFERYRKGEVPPGFGDYMESDVWRCDGERFPGEIRMRRVSVDGAIFVVAEIRDLSERAEAEAEQRRLTQLLRDAVESLPVGFAISDSTQRVVLCNKAFAEPYGSVPEDLVGRGRDELVRRFYDSVRTFNGVSVADTDRYLQMVMDRLGNPSAAPAEVELNNGEWRLVSSFPTVDGGTVTIRTDITMLKQAEKALRDSESMIRQAVEACPVPLGLVRLGDGLIIYESPAAKKLFARDTSHDPVYTSGTFVDDNDRERFLDLLRAGGVHGMEVRLRRADGGEFWGSISARLIDYLSEESIVISVFDETDRHAVEEEMARQREALHQSEKLAALGELLASVAHELNNPLSVVVGQALLLKETAKDSTIVDRAAKIGSAADRCSRIVRTFLAMARQQPMERRPVDLNRVVELAMEVTGYSLRAADIEVRLSFGADMPSVWGDADQLNQVLTNLILNAQKALEESKGPRRIKIITSYRENSREVVLKLKDNGPGIPEAIRSRIFEPFFTTRQVGSGTGIGLAFCHRIITTHGGSISVETGIDGGASFVIRLPVTRITRRQAESEAIGADHPPAATVLVVDDEASVAEMLADILGEDGHSIEIAHSGSQALDILGLRDFDLVLSDLRMPDIDGPAMYDALRESRPEMVSRIAFITGDTMSARIRNFLQETRRPYIEKPITPRDVRDLVRQMLRESGQLVQEETRCLPN